MARINGVDLPREKRVEIGLTYIYGIGRTTATKICVECNVNVDTRVKDLTEDEVNATAAFVTARASRSAASAPTLTLVPARARSVRSVLRRRNKER